MRGGTIPGTVHLTHFRPLLAALFGPRWYEKGSISMYYTFATTDGEPVRAIVEAPKQTRDDIQLAARVEDEQSRVVCKGTVAIGEPRDATPYVRSLPLESGLEGGRRILSRMQPGAELPTEEAYIVTAGDEDGAVLDLQMIYRALAVNIQGLVNQPAVGFFGATEIRLHGGPIKTGTPYKKTGRIVCVGESSKTEFAWFDSLLQDKHGRIVADMRHMTRWMKVSSPLWSD